MKIDFDGYCNIKAPKLVTQQKKKKKKASLRRHAIS